MNQVDEESSCMVANEEENETLYTPSDSDTEIVETRKTIMAQAAVGRSKMRDSYNAI